MAAAKKNAAQVADGPPKDRFAALRNTQIIDSKPVLPAELISYILDYLAGPELIHFALTSRRMRDMVYDDSRWISKLSAMGCWNEAEARQRADEGRRKRLEAQRMQSSEGAHKVNGTVGGGYNTNYRAMNETLFDAGIEESRDSYNTVVGSPRSPKRLQDGFSAINLSPTGPTNDLHAPQGDPNEVLNVIRRCRSLRGYARQEYGKIHGALAPYYFDLLIASTYNDSMVFRAFKQPEKQAQMLSQLKVFAKADIAEGCRLREDKLDSVTGTFENSALREFEHGTQAEDVEGDMKKYANVLVTLNGGASAIDIFIQRSSIISNRQALGRPSDALAGVPSDAVNIQASSDFFRRLSTALNEQVPIIDSVFPISVDVLLPFVRRTIDLVVSEYLTVLFQSARGRTLECYLKAVSITFEQFNQFGASLRPSKASAPEFPKQVRELILQCFEPHVDPYLEKEVEYFKMKCDSEVEAWERQRSELEASTESMYMSNVTRQAAKSDFLKSFRKMVMMPVNALPSMSSKPAARSSVYTGGYTGGTLEPHSRTGSPMPSPGTPGTRPPSPSTLPTTELAAKAAIMNSKLEGIRSLFSIEVALNLVHNTKSSIERLAVFAEIEPESLRATKAKESSETIFISLLKVLGTRHIKGGFDKAVNHLSRYSPRDAVQPKSMPNSPTGSARQGVAPLVTFLELVNVGDLIQQMVDVFFIQELITPKLVDPDDFLDIAVKEKKRFEQMLDERVAAGLNKGIDVLIDEVEYVCATTQKPTDYNPGADGSEATMVDIGPSDTANRVVELLSSHTGMLTGSTDKNVLDVFYQEVGQRLFTVLCKHLKRQRISVDGAIKLISDINHYSVFIASLRQKPLTPYFTALRELAQIYLIDTKDAKDIATVVADAARYHGVITAEEMYEFAERRADWLTVRRNVEKAMYGVGCGIM
ncbi:MAG: F-box protein: endocytic membrane traffic, recycling ReCYcling 1 [Bogoriella megaspora]|nr:MAG: F-box protein: endocytic membrane traffic, recycling ReCYcling 1 [Bogoriella megaspora]